MAIVIQFTGAQSSGKTTLMRALQECFVPRTTATVGETSRSLKTAGVIAELDVKAKTYEQLLINNEYLLRYMTAVQSGASVILAERSDICCVAYARLLNDAFVIESTWKMSDVIRKLPNKIFQFYVPELDTVESDGVRNTASASAVKNEIKNVLSFGKFDCRFVEGASVHDRVSFVLSCVREEVAPWLK